MDIKLPDMLVAVIAHPPVFGAKVKTFDAAAAQKVAGVRAVLPVELDRGGRGVAVVANGYWPAKTGRDALKAEWDTRGPREGRQHEAAGAVPRAGAHTGTPAPGEHLRADVSRIADAPHRIEAEFVFPYLNHAQMEPLACTVDLKDDRCDIYTRVADARRRRDGDRQVHRPGPRSCAHPRADGRWRLRAARGADVATTCSSRWRWPRRSPRPASARRSR